MQNLLIIIISAKPILIASIYKHCSAESALLMKRTKKKHPHLSGNERLNIDSPVNIASGAFVLIAFISVDENCSKKKSGFFSIQFWNSFADWDWMDFADSECMNFDLTSYVRIVVPVISMNWRLEKCIYSAVLFNPFESKQTKHLTRIKRFYL